MSKKYDVIVIGAGSVGVPSALSLAQKGLKVAVIEELPSVGQGQNKKAIGGIRATHTTQPKIQLCLRSIEIFSSWEEKYGHDIEWFKGGYTFVAYTEAHEKLMKDNLEIQQKAGLNIDWVDADRIKELVPGIDETGLRGGTFSPDDGNASPLKAIAAMYDQSVKEGVDYYFNEKVIAFDKNNKTINKVQTDKNEYQADYIINAAGAHARQIGQLLDLDLPVYPDSHEAGISEPVEKFIEPLVVDLRPGPGTKNFYFYQNKEGKFILCLTPEPIIPGKDERETSVFLPQLAARITALVPRTKHLKMRRMWRGLYPMSPDGSPIIGKVKEYENYINCIGMCGQGFMLGPGVGELVARIITDELTQKDQEILKDLSLYRDFSTVEKLK